MYEILNFEEESLTTIRWSYHWALALSFQRRRVRTLIQRKLEAWEGIEKALDIHHNITSLMGHILLSKVVMNRKRTCDQSDTQPFWTRWNRGSLMGIVHKWSGICRIVDNYIESPTNLVRSQLNDPNIPNAWRPGRTYRLDLFNPSKFISSIFEARSLVKRSHVTRHLRSPRRPLGPPPDSTFTSSYFNVSSDTQRFNFPFLKFISPPGHRSWLFIGNWAYNHLTYSSALFCECSARMTIFQSYPPAVPERVKLYSDCMWLCFAVSPL